MSQRSLFNHASGNIFYEAIRKDKEYRIGVDWFLDLHNKPIKTDRLRLVLGWNPSRAVQRIKKDEAKIEKLIKSHLQK